MPQSRTNKRLQPASVDNSEDGRPKRKAYKRKDPKFIPRDQIELVIAAPNIQYITGLRNRLIMEMMYRMGMRVGEVCNLKRALVHPKEDWLVEIREGKTGDRSVWVPRELQPLMEIWWHRSLKELPKSRYLFPTHKGVPVQAKYVYGMVQRMAKRAGIDTVEIKVHPHAFRHTFAHYYLADGGSEGTLQKILGHTTPTMTLWYARASDLDVKQAMQGR